jgi:hypothetical protein
MPQKQDRILASLIRTAAAPEKSRPSIARRVEGAKQMTARQPRGKRKELSNVDRFMKMAERLGIKNVPADLSSDKRYKWIKDRVFWALLETQPEFKRRKPRKTVKDAQLGDLFTLYQTYLWCLTTRTPDRPKGRSVDTGLRKIIPVAQKRGWLDPNMDPDHHRSRLWKLHKRSFENEEEWHELEKTMTDFRNKFGDVYFAK